MSVRKLTILPVILFLHFGLLQNHVTASPISTKFDQRQEGETNVRADLSNIMIVVIPSDGVKLVDTESMGTLLQIFASRRRTAAGSNSPPPPSSPYKVDIEQSAIDRLHADMESLNSIIPASKTFDDKEVRTGDSDMVESNSVSSINKEDEQQTEGSDAKTVKKEKVEGAAASVPDTKNPENEVIDGDVKTEDVGNNDGATMVATTMETIVTSVNSYSKNEGLENGEKFVKLQPASVTVILAKKPETPSGDVPMVTASSVLAGDKKEATQFVEIHKQSSSIAPSKDMPSPLSLTIEDLKRPIQVPSEDVNSKTSTPVKILPKDTKQQQRHHNHQHQSSTKPSQPKKPVASPSTDTVEQSATPSTAPTKSSAKSSKPEVNQQEPERKLKMLQSGLVFCMPGQKLNENGECVNGQIRQSRREDMERLLAALRFGVGPAYRS